jgi:hypothetical protein
MNTLVKIGMGAALSAGASLTTPALAANGQNAAFFGGPSRICLRPTSLLRAPLLVPDPATLQCGRRSSRLPEPEAVQLRRPGGR